MNFDDWIVYVDTARQHAREMQAKIRALEDHIPNAAERAAIEGVCRRFIDACPQDTLLTRPGDVMPFEWEDSPYALLYARLNTLYDAAESRTDNTQLWLDELRVALADFQDGYDWFNARIER